MPLKWSTPRVYMCLHLYDIINVEATGDGGCIMPCKRKPSSTSNI